MRLYATLLPSLIAVVLAAPAGAVAATIRVSRPPGSDASVLASPIAEGAQPVGDGIVYGAGGRGRDWTVWLAAPNGVRRSLAVIPAKPGDEIGVRASATRLVVTHTATVCNDKVDACKGGYYTTLVDDLFVGSLGGPLDPLLPCTPGGPSCAPFPICGDGHSRVITVLDGDLLALNSSCQNAGAVVNLATGVGRPLGRITTSTVAGGLVAVADAEPSFDGSGFATTLVVQDAASGAELFRPGPRAVPSFMRPKFALLADGTLVYAASIPGAAPIGGEAALVVATPATPAGRMLRRIAVDTTIYGAGPGGVLTGSTSSGLELTPLAGGPSTAVPFANNPLGVAFDGRTVVSTQPLCGTDTIISWRPGDPRPQLDPACPTPVPSRAAATLRRDRRLRVALACPASAPDGCLAGVHLTAMAKTRRRAGRILTRSRPLGTVYVVLDPDVRGQTELLVPAAAARWVRTHAPARLRIDVQNSASHRPPGDPGTASRTVALRAA